jgi:hypothetical protein
MFQKIYNVHHRVMEGIILAIKPSLFYMQLFSQLDSNTIGFRRVGTIFFMNQIFGKDYFFQGYRIHRPLYIHFHFKNQREHSRYTIQRALTEVILLKYVTPFLSLRVR